MVGPKKVKKNDTYFLCETVGIIVRISHGLAFLCIVITPRVIYCIQSMLIQLWKYHPIDGFSFSFCLFS